MNGLFRNAPIVKRGTWQYAGAVSCEVRIVRHDVLYGSGDDEDPPEIADDRETECYYVLLQLPVHAESWQIFAAELTLEEAVKKTAVRLADCHLCWAAS